MPDPEIKTAPGSGNWRIIYEPCRSGIRILRAVTCDREAVLPHAIEGVPVTELGEGALKPRDPRVWTYEMPAGMNAEEWHGEEAEAGQQCLVLYSGAVASALFHRGDAGSASAFRWSNHGIRSILLPESIRRISHYAFLNCENLSRIELTDGNLDWGSGVFMNCRLQDLWIRQPEEEGSVLAYFGYELTRELDVRITDAAGAVRARLLFPEYFEISRANVEARQFDFRMEGIGYPYHHVFRNKRMDYLGYDLLWDRCLAHGTEEEICGRIAWFRLQYPYKLEERFAENYRAYLKEHAGVMIRWALEEGTAADLTAILAVAEPAEDAVRSAADAAREAGRTDLLAVLLNRLRGAVPAGRRKRFEL